MSVDINSLKKEYDLLLKELSNPELISDWEKMEELMKKKAFLEKRIEKEEKLKEICQRIEENKTLLASDDQELNILAQEELKQLKEEEAILRKEITELENNKNDNSQKINAIIMEIRAGVGGQEATLFAADLYRMYTKYIKSKGWGFRLLDASTSELGGYKEVIFEVTSPEASEALKWEGGVHRVQRIPETEKSGRIHTSTCSVAILPKPSKTEIKIKPEDLKIDFYRASGPGGQYVNRRETAVRITHLPTGIVVTSQTERNQLENKKNAMAILEARLYQKFQEEEESKITQQRRSQIKQAKRAEKIRTYNFPQDRVTDHRIKKTFHNIQEIMDGNLDPIIEELNKNLTND